MPRIEVLLQGHAGESTVEEIIKEANDATPSGITPRATITRDANGKLVSVCVGLPTEVTSADLATAKNKINGNAGVSKAVSLPLNGTTDFETGFTAGQDLTGTSEVIGDNKATFAKLSASPIDGDFKITTPTDASDGSFSLAWAATTTPTLISTTPNQVRGTMSWSAVDQGLTVITSFKFTVKMTSASTYATISRAKGNTKHVVGFFNDLPFPAANLRADSALNGGNWTLGLGATNVDTGRAESAQVELEVELNPFGLYTAKELFSGSTVTKDFGFPQSFSTISFITFLGDRDSALTTMDRHAMVFDDLTMNITG